MDCLKHCFQGGLCTSRSLPIAAFLPSLLVATTVMAQAAPPDPRAPDLSRREQVEQLIERVKFEQSRVETMRADFVQRKTAQFLLEPEESRGVFHFKAPDRLRWEYQQPQQIVMTIQGDEMVSFYRDHERAERVDIGKYSDQVFKYLGASGSLETLLKYFSLTADLPSAEGDPYHLRLSPLYSRIKKRIAGMEIWIDSTTYLPERIKYVEADGDLTEYQFENLAVNEAVPEELFSQELPQGVEVKTIELRAGN